MGEAQSTAGTGLGAGTDQGLRSIQRLLQQQSGYELFLNCRAAGKQLSSPAMSWCEMENASLPFCPTLNPPPEKHELFLLSLSLW